MAPKQQLSPSVHLCAGITAGTVATVATFPLDLVKVRYQANDCPSTRISLISAFRNIVSTEGAAGLYQGITPAIYGNAISWGGYFFLYERAKERKRNRWSSPTAATLASATEAGTIMVMISNPIWLIKTRMQLQLHSKDTASAAHKGYRSFSHAVRSIVAHEGPLALYKGAVPALMLVSHGVVQFGVYEFIKSKVLRSDGASDIELPLGARMPTSAFHFLNGAASKLVASTTTYPLQVVKTRLQQRHIEGAVSTSRKYSGVVDCVRGIVQEEGWRAFFKGALPNALRVVPAAAVTFLVYEEIVQMTRTATFVGRLAA